MNLVLSGEFERIERAFTTAIRRIRFREKHQIEFLEEFLGMFKHCERPLEILKHMHTFGDATRKQVCQAMIPKVRGGKGVAAGMEGWFNPMVIEACRVGQSSGRLGAVLEKTLAAMKVQRAGMLSTLSWLIYPFLLTVGFSVLSIRLKDGTIATLLRFRNVTYDTLTPQLKFVHSYATAMENYWFIIIAVIVGLFVGMSWVLVNYAGPWRDTLDNYPLFKQYRFLTGAKFMRMYSILKDINVTEARIFKTLSQFSSPYYKSHLVRMNRRREAGTNKSIASVLDTGLISRANIARLSLLSGYNSDYAAVLSDCATVVVESTAKNVKVVARVFAACWMLVVGAALATAIIGVQNINQVVGV